MLLSFRLDPNRKDHRDAFQNVIEGRNTAYRVIEDLELEAAKRVSWRCGIPFGEIVYYTDSEIRRRYEKYCETHPDHLPVDGGMNTRYPISFIKERRETDAQHEQIAKQMWDGKDIRISSDYTEDSLSTTLPPPRPAASKVAAARRPQVVVTPAKTFTSATSAANFMKNI